MRLYRAKLLGAGRLYVTTVYVPPRSRRARLMPRCIRAVEVAGQVSDTVAPAAVEVGEVGHVLHRHVSRHCSPHPPRTYYCTWPAVLPSYILYEYMPLAVSLIYMSGLYGYYTYLGHELERGGGKVLFDTVGVYALW